MGVRDTLVIRDLRAVDSGTTDDVATAVVHGRASSAYAGPPPRGIGTTLGRYFVLEEAGRGGMGRVLRAYDPKLQREVALKEVWDASLFEAGAARLIAEARAMARLSHANVVGVYDVEEIDREHLVLVMEYVDGQTLAQWLAQFERPWPEVVAIFCDAARGLAAAHEVGLLHRDFKPSNVLVTPEGVAKVTDFGLAKGIGTDASCPPSTELGALEGERVTAAGLVMGTPRYMPPEQESGEALSPAADQYAFCVALWEALCGEAPYRGAERAARKREGPPPWPRRDTPRRICDAICRGLSPAPADRWPSMAGLLAGLERESAWHRHRWALMGAGGLLGAFGVVGALALPVDARCRGAEAVLAEVWDRHRRAEVEAKVLGVEMPYVGRAWERAVATLDGYAADWVAMHTEACEATSIRGEQSAAIMDLRMTCLHRARLELGAVVAQFSDADVNVARNAHELTSRLPPLSRCADTDALRAGTEPPLPAEAEAVQSVRARLADAGALLAAGRYDRAVVEIDAARALGATLAYGPVQTEIALVTGQVSSEIGNDEAASAALEEALRLAARWRQHDEMRRAATKLLFVVGNRLQRPAEAYRYRELAAGLADGDPKNEALVHEAVANTLRVEGRYDDAVAKYREALALMENAPGAEPIAVAGLRAGLANALDAQGDYVEAERWHREALRVQEAELGPFHPIVVITRNNLASARYSQGKYEEVEAEFRDLVTLWTSSMGPDHPGVANVRTNLANALRSQEKHAESVVEYRRALDQREAMLGPDHPEVGAARCNLANALASLGEGEASETEYRRAIGIFVSSLGKGHPHVAIARANLAAGLRSQGLLAEAKAEYERALEGLEAALGHQHPDLATVRANLADVLLAEGQVSEAFELASLAWEQHQHESVPPALRGDTAFLLARALWEIDGSTDARARATALATGALADYERAGSAAVGRDEPVRGWLRLHR